MIIRWMNAFSFHFFFFSEDFLVLNTYDCARFLSLRFIYFVFFILYSSFYFLLCVSMCMQLNCVKRPTEKWAKVTILLGCLALLYTLTWSEWKQAVDLVACKVCIWNGTHIVWNKKITKGLKHTHTHIWTAWFAEREREENKKMRNTTPAISYSVVVLFFLSRICEHFKISTIQSHEHAIGCCFPFSLW